MCKSIGVGEKVKEREGRGGEGRRGGKERGGRERLG